MYICGENQKYNIMKNLSQKITLLFSLILIATTTLSASSKDDSSQIYEWRYYMVNDGCTEQFDQYLRDVLRPAYARMDVETAVFEMAMEALNEKQLAEQKELGERRMVLFIYDDIDDYQEAKNQLWSDKKFKKAAQPFFDKWAVTPAYSNMESFLCEAFDKMPELKKPKKNHTLFELRTYRSPNEEAGQRKVKMFNKDEMSIFKQIGVNMVCFGEVLNGPIMPALIYLTSYDNNEQRKEAWSKFGKNDDWNRIKVLPEYANTVIKNRTEVVKLLPYSEDFKK